MAVAKNPAKYRAAWTRWRRENPEKLKGQTRRWNHKRRALLRDQEQYTQAEWEALLEVCDYRCLGCGRRDVPPHADHIIPLSLGGVGTIDNIQPLCQPCNSKKYMQSVDYRPKKPKEEVHDDLEAEGSEPPDPVEA